MDFHNKYRLKSPFSIIISWNLKVHLTSGSTPPLPTHSFLDLMYPLETAMCDSTPLIGLVSTSCVPNVPVTLISHIFKFLDLTIPFNPSSFLVKSNLLQLRVALPAPLIFFIFIFSTSFLVMSFV